MELHGALNDFKRSQGEPRRFPGERRSTRGLFSGLDERLVHVAPDGSIRDYSYPLSGLAGIERSRFGLETDGDVRWFDADDADQRYVDDTAVVETTHAVGDATCVQYDVTIDRLHLTHFELERGSDVAGDVSLHACVGFAPEGRAGRVGQLWHGDAVEVHHDAERDFLAASTELSVTGQVPARFAELLASEPADFPRSPTDDRYEEARLSPIAMCELELTGSTPSATVATLLSDGGDRAATLEHVRTAVAEHADRETVLEAGRGQACDRLPDPDRLGDGGLSDLRALALLRAPTGARIAGPEFDPFYRYSGGYGYTWFRDDAEIARFLLAADRRLALGLEAWHEKSARFYAETQLSDGTWPHRVWPHNGALAPGWAHGRLEGGESEEYQADQTASVAAFLATYLRHVDPDDERIRETLASALDGLDDSLAADGLPERVQNAWENMTGRFAHTAATFLEAYAAVARAPVDDALAARARERARTVYDALDDLWVPDRGIYAMRTDGDDVDDRLDSSTLALASAHREYAALEDVDIDGERLDRLASHVETTIDGLYRDPEGPVEGLARFEGDPWRVRDQDAAKIWTVTTAWGAHAAVELRELLAASDREEAEAFDERARNLLALVEPGGSLRRPGGYLPEQVFDDGTPDSATPLGWPHAIRLATASALEESASPARADAEYRAPLQD
ncbi:Glucoamylase and related glycosyl hydrolase- like protein [Haloterrigena turkmenica DSM 5511]|uniref:Glucoamylase and related glycosyl hydrolase-like protein n=1 Tax=Haloterrigena turkmenica (strain ATCC 51198 / DSM 5511 / JCM 9101 / NCIMB 13204 / VKM B-1734 / 4k) TaxID=543526 RepID=D2RWM2_HALTV|nr:glycoside hydrolase family 15 protein [Haloterrigena turkmenica]ADB61523.1 Glucoamylase and related glycosyl hydrolase- like protein [Haloterrigena turkmenica DSM 5511]